MRISDWSSDVCSSDLELLLYLSNLRPQIGLLLLLAQRLGNNVQLIGNCSESGKVGMMIRRRFEEVAKVGMVLGEPRGRQRSEGRRVGKGGVVGVDVGGGSIMKKKT